ncbi:MAG: ABC transporter substrate-binding protein, partial [Promethearchaeota archaeon]
MKSFQKYLILTVLIFPLISSVLFGFGFESFNKTSNKITEDKNDPLLSDIIVNNYIVPGVTGSLSPDQIIKIGVLDDLESLSGEHAVNGALLAAKEINLAGGIDINGSQHYVGIVAENTDEANPNLDITKAVAAAETMVNVHDPHFIVGGYRTEALMAYIEVIMDYEIPFIGTGCQTDVFCQNVLDNYNRYKYFFRGMPLNSTSIGVEFITYILTIANVLGAMYSGTVDTVAIFREDLGWTVPLSSALNAYLPIYGLTVVEDIACPVYASTPEVISHMVQIEASEAQILIPLISSELGILMDMAYEVVKPKCLMAGMNTLAQLDSYWDDTQGACQYEVLMQHTFRTNKTDQTIPFWDAYLNEYDKEPYYTGVGAYDAVRLLAHAVNKSKSFNPDVIVSQMEKVNKTNPFLGASGNIAFTNSHDLEHVVPTWNMLYPDSIATAPLMVPYWGINNLVGEMDLPGDFTLTTDAINPDTNGDFILYWTESQGAEEYSLYMSDSYITYINQDLDLISHQYDNLPYEITDLETGKYYFILASYNISGETLSNCIYVDVLRPVPGLFTLTSDATNPDTDGSFNLSWTSSEGADNYSVYKHTGPITEINETIEVLAYQNATSPFQITETADGIYYYGILAVNATGVTLSNTIFVNVSFPPPDHDLGVYLQVPISIESDTSYIINASVKNLGLSDEVDVQLFLYLDEVLVDSIIVPYLSFGASGTIQYEWTPTEYRAYNFTAIAPPVPLEPYLDNNRKTTIVDVSETELFDGLYIKHTFSQMGYVYNTNFTYTPYTSDLYNVSFGMEYMGLHMSYPWIVDALTRIMSGGSIFGDGAYTPAWIFTDTSLHDTIPIAVDGEGDHDFYVARELIHDLPGFGLGNSLKWYIFLRCRSV